MAVTRTGTAQLLDCSAGSGTVGCTVPSDCTLILLHTHWYTGGSGETLSSASIDGTGFTLVVNTDNAGQNGSAVGHLKNPSTGSQTLSWSWTGGARAEGGGIILTYVKGEHASSFVNDSGQGQAFTGSGQASCTINSNSTDLVIGSGQAYGMDPEVTATNYIDNSAVNSENYDASDVTAGASTTTVQTGTGKNYPAVAAISIIEAAAGGGGATPHGVFGLPLHGPFGGPFG